MRAPLLPLRRSEDKEASTLRWPGPSILKPCFGAQSTPLKLCMRILLPEKAKTAMTMAVSHQDAALHHGGVQRSGKEILRTIEQKAEQKAKNVRT